MNQKHSRLLKVLLQAESPLTAQDIAQKLSISIRSVRNYVREINASQQIIQAGRFGYEIIQKKAALTLCTQENTIPENFKERSLYMLKLWLIERTYYDIYTLAELLCVSDITLRNDIAKMNVVYEPFGISISMKNDFPQLHGSEKNRRKVISHIINEESTQQFLNLSLLKDNFPNMDVDKAISILQGCFASHHVYLNDFALMNIVLHLIILLNRIHEGRTINGNESISFKKDELYTLVIDLITQIEDNFSICIGTYEISELYHLIEANIQNPSMNENHSAIIETIGEPFHSQLDAILHEVLDRYQMDLFQDAFYYPFLLHCKNLFTRSMQGIMIRNPMKSSIMHSYPMLYDIAIYICMRLQKLYQITISQDEAAYIAIHIGSEVERQKKDNQIMKAGLLCPDYHHMQKQLYYRIQSEFTEKLSIVAAYTTMGDIKEENFDFLITTIPLTQTMSYPIVEIAYIPTKADYYRIYQTMMDLQEEQIYQLLKKEFKKYFNPDSFFVGEALKNAEDCISFLCGNLCEQGCVDKDYEQAVLERERAASTRFRQLAIPHAVHVYAKQSRIAVLLSKTGVLWDDDCVHIVLLIAISREDQKEFSKIYESITAIFSDTAKLNLVKNAKDFNAFHSCIFT